MLPKFNKNEEREREKGGERKKRNFGNTVTKILLPKLLPVQLKKKAIAATPLPKKEKKNCFGNCGNAIADNVKKKKKKKKILTIVAIPSPKMEKKIMKYVNE